MLLSMSAIGWGVSHSADPTLSTEERDAGAAIAYAGAQSLESAIDVLGAAELVNAMSPFKVTNPVPENLGLHPIMQEAVASSTIDDGTLTAVRSPAQGAEYASPFLPQKPVIAKETTQKWPFGIRRVSTKAGEDLGFVVSDLDPAYRLDAKGNLLPETKTYNPQNPNSFSSRVNKNARYDAVQTQTISMGVSLHPEKGNSPLKATI